MFYSNDPRFEDPRYGYAMFNSSGTRFTNFIQDAARVTRYWTITPGLALTTSSSSNSRGLSVTDGTALTPHISTAWDATHDGRTVLRGSFNQYVDPDVGRLARHSLGTRVSQECRWNATTQAYTDDCRSPAVRRAPPSDCPAARPASTQTATAAAQKLRIPRTWEYTLGAEREVIPGLGVGLDFVYRDFTHPYATKETNRIWNRSRQRARADRRLPQRPRRDRHRSRDPGRAPTRNTRA